MTPYWWQRSPIELRRRKSFSLCKFLLIKIMHVLTCTCSCHLKCLFIGYMDMHRLRQWVLSLGEGNLKIGSIFVAYGLLTYQNPYRIIAELAERSPIIIQNSSNPSSRKNLDVRPYDRTRCYFFKTCVVNWFKESFLFSPVVSALGSESVGPLFIEVQVFFFYFSSKDLKSLNGKDRVRHLTEISTVFNNFFP